jgi:hypothetical protein
MAASTSRYCSVAKRRAFAACFFGAAALGGLAGAVVATSGASATSTRGSLTGVEPIPARVALLTPHAALTTSAGTRVTALSGQTADGSTCTLFRTDQPTHADSGFCESPAATAKDEAAYILFISFIPEARGAIALVEAAADAGSAITAFQVEDSGQPIAEAAGGGYLIGELGRTAKVGTLPVGKDFIITGLSADGKTVLSINLNQLVRNATPPAGKH